MKNCCFQLFSSLRTSLDIETTKQHVTLQLSTFRFAGLDSDCQGCRKLSSLTIMHILDSYSRIYLPSDGCLESWLAGRISTHGHLIKAYGNKVAMLPRCFASSMNRDTVDQMFDSCKSAIMPRSMNDSVLFYMVKNGYPRDLWIGLEHRRIKEILNHSMPLNLLPDPRQVPLIGSFEFQQIDAWQSTNSIRIRSSNRSISHTKSTKDHEPSEIVKDKHIKVSVSKSQPQNRRFSKKTQSRLETSTNIVDRPSTPSKIKECSIDIKEMKSNHKQRDQRKSIYQISDDIPRFEDLKDVGSQKCRPAKLAAGKRHIPKINFISTDSVQPDTKSSTSSKESSQFEFDMEFCTQKNQNFKQTSNFIYHTTASHAFDGDDKYANSMRSIQLPCLNKLRAEVEHPAIVSLRNNSKISKMGYGKQLIPNKPCFFAIKKTVK